MLSRPKKLLFTFAILVLPLLALEGLARIGSPPDPRFRIPSETFRARGGLDANEVDEIMVGDPDLFWRLRPGLYSRPWFKPLWIDTRTNSLGLRSPEIRLPKPLGNFRVLCLGDSCTYGSAVRMGEAYPARLEQILNTVYEGGVWEVVNGGTPGYSSFQGMKFLERHGRRVGADIVTLSFWINDSAPWTGMSDQEFHNRLGHPLANTLLNSALLRLISSPFIHAPQTDSPDETKLPQKGSNPLERNLSLARATPQQFAAQMKRLLRMIRAQGASPVLILHPWKVQIEGTWDHPWRIQSPWQQEIQKLAKDEKVPLVNLLETLRGRPERFIDNCHLDAEGCRLIAVALFRKLQECRLIPEIPTLQQRRQARLDRILKDG